MTTIPTRTPHNEEIDVHLHSNKVTTDALRLAMRANGAKMSTGSMMLLNRERGTLLEGAEAATDPSHDLSHTHDLAHVDHHHDHKHSLSSLGIMSGDRIDIIQRMGVTNVGDIVYKQFLNGSTPEHMAHGVPCDVHPVVHFVENAVGNHVYLPSYTLPHEETSVDQMQTELGAEEAEMRGFVCWTDTVLSCKVHIVEIDMSAAGSTVHDKVNHARFCYGKANKDYMGVDVHSWQRYTKKLPVPCDIVMDLAELIPKRMTLVPKCPLRPGTWYAIVLQNGVQLTPTALLMAGLSTFCHDCVCEDHLICFITEEMSPSPAGAES
jgi:hypothetical protein